MSRDLRVKAAYLTHLGAGELGDCLTARGSLLRVEGVVAGGVVAGGVVAGGVVAGGVTGRVTGAAGSVGVRAGVVGVVAGGVVGVVAGGVVGVVAGGAVGVVSAARPAAAPGRYGTLAAGCAGVTGR
jgi:hypothetical protein